MVLILALMAVASGAAVWYDKPIRTGRAEPVINPAWTNGIRAAPLQSGDVGSRCRHRGRRVVAH
jgi:hypothetical protein